MQTPEEVRKFLMDAVAHIKRTVVQIVQVEAMRSIKRNFEQGGRPEKWTPSKKTRKRPNSKTLIVTGNLSNVTATANEAESSVTLTTSPLSRAYARIHQEGGTISHPSRPLKFRLKRSKSGRVRTVFASSSHKRIVKSTTSKPYTVAIPARPYLLIPQEDIDSMIRKIESALGGKQ